MCSRTSGGTASPLVRVLLLTLRVSRYTEVDDEPSLLRRDRFDYDGDNMDEQVVSVAYARQLEAEQEAAALLQDAIGDVREHMDAYDMQMVDD